MSKNLSLFVLSVVPRRALSRFVGRLMHFPLPSPLRQWTVLGFGKFYQIRFDEAEKPYQQYQSIGDFFTRKLKTGARPIESQATLVHPADSEISQFQTLQNQELIQAKGLKYTLKDFLTPEMYNSFKNEELVSITYYLCPTDYHRVHSPVDGKITRALHVPGDLWPVNKGSVSSVPSLFAVNERVNLEIQTSLGPVALIFVGATNVGQMRMSFDPQLVTNIRSDEKQKMRDYSPAIEIKKGDELGLFSMGSTVVMIYPKRYFSSVDFQSWLGQKVLMGKTLV